MSKKRALIMLNMSYQRDWDTGMVNRNYHVLHTLLKNNTYDCIISVDFLPFSFKKRLKVLVENQPWKKNASTIRHTLTARLDGDTKDSRLYHISAATIGGVQAMLSSMDLPEDVTLWSYTPFCAEWLDQLPHTQFVFDAVDNWLAHPAYTQYTQRLKNCYETIRQKADTIFTVSENLLTLFEGHTNVHWIPNGVDVDHYKGRTCALQDRSSYIAVIGYHGVIQSRVDLALIDTLAKRFPKYQFIIIGPVWKEMQSAVDALKAYSNVQFMGALSYDAYPDYLACFDLAIIPHRIDKLTQSMNPLKMYEYLACGIPIVSTPVAGVEHFQEYIRIAKTAQDFEAHIQEALQGDSEQQHRNRIHIAREQSWTVRVQQMIAAI